MSAEEVTLRELKKALADLPIDRLRRLAAEADSRGDGVVAELIEGLLPTNTFMPRRQSWLAGSGCLIVVVREHGTSRQAACVATSQAEWDADLLSMKAQARAAVESGARSAAVYNVRKLHACKTTDLVFEVETPGTIPGEE